MNDKRLVFIKSIDDLNFYEYKVSLFNYYYKPLAYYEKTIQHTIRQTLAFIRGGYKVVYVESKGKLLGYGVVTRGVCRKIIECILKDLNLSYQNAYEYIAPSNTPSIKAAEKNGFIYDSKVDMVGLFRKLIIVENGHNNLYKR